MGLGALLVCSPRLFLNVDEVTAAVEGIGSIKLITEAKFEVGICKWVMVEKGFWDMTISLSESI